MDDTSNDTLSLFVSRLASPLPKPRIPDADDGGLGYDDILRIPDRNLSVDVGPWDGFEDGDTVRVLVGPDQRIFGSAPASAKDKYGTVTVVVPARSFSFLANGTYDVVAQVVNQLSIPVDSPPQPVRLKLSVPGGLDPVADTTHRNENLAAPTVEPMLIDKDTSVATVTVPAWDNIAQGDRLILRWGLAGNEMTYDVIDQAAPVPPFAVDRATIDKGGSGSKVEVTYHVFDVVGNWSLFAPPTNVEVESPDALPPPWIAPTVGDAGEAIDVPALAGGDATAEVFGLQAGDVVTVKFLGTTADGSATEYTPPPQTVIVSGRPLLFVLPNRLFPPLIQGTCAVGYTAVRGGAPLPPSSLRRLSVTGEAVSLAPPSVDEAIGDTIDPAHVTNGAHASVSASPLIAPGTRVTLDMYGTTTGNVPVGHQDYRDIGDNTAFPLHFLIPAGKIASLAGSSATFVYTVDTFFAMDDGRQLHRRMEGNGALPSPERTYRILGSSVNLPPPSVPEAENGRLDPAKVDPLIGVRVDVDDVVANDRVTVTWIGTKYTTPYTETLTAHGSRVSYFVPKTPFVDANVDADVEVTYTVEGKGRSDPLSLHIGVGLGALPPPSVDEAPNGTLDPADAAVGVTVRVPTLSPPLLATDQVRVRFGTYETPPKAGNEALVFTVPAAQIGPYMGRTVTVSYTVVRNAVPYPSQDLPLEVLRFADGDTRLPTPIVPQASGNKIDLDTFAGNATVTVAPWPLIAVGQKIWLEVHGIASGQARTISLRTASPVSSGEVTAGLNATLARTELEALDDNSTVTVAVSVSFDGSSNPSDAVLFPQREYTLVKVSAVVPKIVHVVDSVPNSIPNGGYTPDTTLTLTGTAKPDQQVEIFDGSTSMGTATVGASGNWYRTVSGLAEGSHSFTAKGRYGSNPESTPWVVNVGKGIVPNIDLVVDAVPNSIPNGGSTPSTSLTLRGTAPTGQRVEIFDGSTSMGTTTVGSLDTWFKSFGGLAVGRHSFTAKGLYGSNPESTPWVVNVGPDIVPNITNVADSKGSVPNGGSTSDTALTLTGTAKPNQQVEIFDGSTSKGTAAVNASGNWSRTVSGLAAGSHSFTAKGRYGSNPESTPWVVYVGQGQDIVPNITRVIDSKGNAVANGGTTSDTTLTLSGTAQPNQQVRLFDGSTAKGTADVNASGNWSLTVSGLAAGVHNFKARGLYGSNPESAVWRVTVGQSLTIDTTPVTLSGETFAWSDPGYSLSPVVYANSSVSRPASGGSPPYTYTSSNTDVARVDTVGLVRARRNGTATITVRDSGNQTASYSVTVTNAWLMEYIGNFVWNGAIQYQPVGGHLPTGDEMNWRIRPNWSSGWPRQETDWWTSDVKGIDALAVNVKTGNAYYTLKAFSMPSLSVYR